MIQKKNDNISKSVMILMGLIVIVLPIIFNYKLSSKIGQIALGISFISSAIIENKIIKRIIAVSAIGVILYSYFKWGI